MHQTNGNGKALPWLSMVVDSVNRKYHPQLPLPRRLQPETFPLQSPPPMENISPPQSAVHNTCVEFLAASITPSQPYPFLSFLSLYLCFFIY